MDKRNKFAEILYSAKFANIAEPDIAEKSLSAISSWIKSNIPEKLYRYRSVSENSISAFRNDEIWASTPSSFNDSFECMPCFELDRAQKSIYNEFDMENLKKLLFKMPLPQPPTEFTDVENLKKLLFKMRDDGIPPRLNALSADGYLKNFLDSVITAIDTPDFEKMVYLARNVFMTLVIDDMDAYASYFYRSIDSAMNRYMVACFTESNTSSLMWGHYAQSHRGFCLEYNFQPIVGDCTRKCDDILQCNNLMLNYALAPIIYSPKRFDATESYIAMVINELKDIINPQVGCYYPDMLLPMKLLLTKSAEWEYEKEWRLFMAEGQIEAKPKSIVQIKPTAVYCGTRMSENDKNVITSIAIEKGIPCYQIIPHYFSSDYEIRAVDMSLLEQSKS